MYSRVNYMIVGLFVLLFGAGLVWFAFWLGKYGTSEEYYTYRLEMSDSVAGLSVDSNVMYRGVGIGRVSDIRINPENIEQIEVFLKINRDVPIKENMVASTKMFGVTGLLSIEIEGGSNGAKTLKPTDEHIPTIKTKPSLVTTLSLNIESLSVRLDRLLLQGEKILSDDNIEKVKHILSNVEELTKGSQQVKEETMSLLEEFRVNIKKISQNFEGATEDFASMKKVFLPAVKNFNRMALKIEQSLDRGDYNLKKILEPVLVDMQILVSQMGDLATELEESPSDLIFKSRTPLKGPGE
ncbi:MAG: MlaD family protein [Sulfurimonas sp.]